MLRVDLRIFRRLFVFFAIVAAWLGWSLVGQMPLKEMKVTWTDGKRYKHVDLDPSDQEHALFGTWDVGVGATHHLDFKTGMSGKLMDADLRLKGQLAPDRSWFASIKGGVVELVDLPGRKTRFTWPDFWEPTVSNEQKQLAALGASGDSRSLVITSVVGQFTEVRDVATGKRRLRLDDGGGTAAISADGSRLAVMDSLGVYHSDKVRIYDVESGRKLTELAPPGDHSEYLLYSPNGRLLIGRDKNYTGDPKDPSRAEAELWSADFEKLATFHLTFRPNSLRLHHSTFSPDGRFLILSAALSEGMVWDLGVNPPRCIDEQLGLLPTGKDDVEMKFSKAGDQIAIRESSDVRLYQLPTLNEVPLSFEDVRSTEPFGFSPSGRWLSASKYRSGSDLQNHLWFYSDRWLSTSNWLAEEVVIWDTRTGEPRYRLPGKHVVAWTEDASKAWVLYEQAVDGYECTFRLYRLSNTPPWWLWLLTATGIGVIFWDIRRTWKRRTLASGVA
ncbi:MAG: WD40 repeat domain-containing protein [Gemmataceae bacterium]